MVDGPHGPSLHRRHLERGPEGCRAHRVPPRFVGRAVAPGVSPPSGTLVVARRVRPRSPARTWASKSPWRGSSSRMAGEAFATPLSRPEPCGRPSAGLDNGFFPPPSDQRRNETSLAGRHRERRRRSPRRRGTARAPSSARTTSPRSDAPGTGPCRHAPPGRSSSGRSQDQCGLFQVEQLGAPRPHCNLREVWAP